MFIDNLCNTDTSISIHTKDKLSKNLPCTDTNYIVDNIILLKYIILRYSILKEKNTIIKPIKNDIENLNYIEKNVYKICPIFTETLKVLHGPQSEASNEFIINNCVVTDSRWSEASNEFIINNCVVTDSRWSEASNEFIINNCVVTDSRWSETYNEFIINNCVVTDSRWSEASNEFIINNCVVTDSCWSI